jgi:endonuclease/exonuclease/phosphatase (EEP) superfamily protein YafD
MFTRIRYFVLLIVIVLPAVVLQSCVTVDEKTHLVSNSAAFHSDTQQCDSRTDANIQATNVQGLNPDNISILNWNIYKGNGDGWEQDLAVFAQNHDVMTIQEATLDESLTGLLRTHNLDWVMNTAFHMNGTAAGVMTVANSNAVYSCGFKTKEPLIRIPKSTLISYYSIDGLEKKLLVANIHGINFTLGVKVYRQQLNHLYDVIKHHDGPMIVAGDFNSWSDVRLDEVNKFLEKLSLSALEYSVNNKTHIFGNAIDHVFYRYLEPVSKKVWQVSSSDHNPVSVSFKVQSEVF